MRGRAAGGPIDRPGGSTAVPGYRGGMNDPSSGSSPGVDPLLARLRPLIRTRQIREFTAEPLTASELEALTEAARWTGSSRNEQPWHLITIEDEATLRTIAEAGLPQTRALGTATAAIAVVLPADPERRVSDAYDDGRLAERILVAATILDLGAGITWIRRDVAPVVAGLLGLPPDRSVRTIVALGHPSEAARRPKSAPGQARRPRSEVVLEERWPSG